MDTRAAKLSYQVSPIFLTGGSIPANSTIGGAVPLLALIAPQLFPQLSNLTGGVTGVGGLPVPTTVTTGQQGPLSPAQTTADMNQLDDYGAFSVIAGGGLIKQEVAKYPFANNYVAANATIREPLNLSMIWDTPYRVKDPWGQKLINTVKIKMILDEHNNRGGTYTVVTPGYIYTNMLLTALTDASRGTSPLPQNAWRFDFEKPLIAISDLTTAQNQLFSKVSGGLPTDGEWTGSAAGLGTLTSLPNFNTAVAPVMSALGMNSGLPSGPVSPLPTSPATIGV